MKHKKPGGCGCGQRGRGRGRGRGRTGGRRGEAGVIVGVVTVFQPTADADDTAVRRLSAQCVLVW